VRRRLNGRRPNWIRRIRLRRNGQTPTGGSGNEMELIGVAVFYKMCGTWMAPFNGDILTSVTLKSSSNQKLINYVMYLY
jgi:hypothetical protein